LSLEKIKKLSDELMRINGVIGVVFSSSDGLPIFTTLVDSDLEEKSAALSAVLAEVGDRALKELLEKDHSWIGIYAPDSSGVIVVKINENSNLMVIFDKEAKLGVLLYTIKNVISQLNKKE